MGTLSKEDIMSVVSEQEGMYKFNKFGIDYARNRIKVSKEEWLGRNRRVRTLRAFLKGHVKTVVLNPILPKEQVPYIVCLTKWNALIREEECLLESYYRGIMNGTV